eukprot:EG_transcript_1926
MRAPKRGPSATAQTELSGAHCTGSHLIPPHLVGHSSSIRTSTYTPPLQSNAVSLHPSPLHEIFWKFIYRFVCSIKQFRERPSETHLAEMKLKSSVKEAELC